MTGFSPQRMLSVFFALNFSIYLFLEQFKLFGVLLLLFIFFSIQFVLSHITFAYIFFLWASFHAVPLAGLILLHDFFQVIDT